MVIGKAILVLMIILLNLFSAAAAENDCIYYFYGKNCEECQAASNHVKYLQTKYPELQITEYEVYYNRENSKTLDQYFTAYNVPPASRGVPTVFTADSYFIGSKSIGSLLEGRIVDNVKSECPSLIISSTIGVAGDKNPSNVLDTITLSMVTKSAIKDSIRPGAIAFMLILLMLLSVRKKKEVHLRNGIMAIGIIAIVSVLFGMGLFWRSSAVFPKIIGMLAIIGSLFRIKGFFGTWRIMFEEIREETEQKIRGSVKYLHSPFGIAVISLILGLISFGTISEVFTLLRTLSEDGVIEFRAFAYLFYHAIITSIPPAIVVGIVYKVTEALENHAVKKEPHDDNKAETWRKHTQKVFKFVVSSLMLLMGLVLLFY